MSTVIPDKVAPPDTHEQVDTFTVDEPENPGLCHLLGADGRPLCKANGLGMDVHSVPGDPTASPCTGGCGRARCPACALAYAFPTS